MKIFTTLLILFSLSPITNCQIIEILDLSYKRSLRSMYSNGLTNDNTFFSGGNLDFSNGGVIQGAADVLRFKFRVGKHKVPAIFKGGAGADLSNSEGKINESVANDIHSNYGGIIIFGINDKYAFKNKDGNYSGFTIPYFLGTKFINGIDSTNLEKVNFFTGMANLGFNYQNIVEAGVFSGTYWLQAASSFFIGGRDSMENIFGPRTNNILYGVNIEFGLNIENLVNFRIGYYKYFNNQEISEFENGVFKIAFNYNK